MIKDMMPSVRMRTMRVAFAGLFFGLCACGAVDQRPDMPGQVFLDASTLAQQRMTVQGFLRYASEDKSLYPSGTNLDSRSRKACLPVLVRLDDKDLDIAARRLSGKDVEIDGVIASVASPGNVGVNSCKQFGVVVLAIREL